MWVVGTNIQINKDKAFVLNIELEMLDMQVKTMSYGQISLELMGEVRTRDIQFLLILRVLPAFQLHAVAEIVCEARKKKLQHWSLGASRGQGENEERDKEMKQELPTR